MISVANSGIIQSKYDVQLIVLGNSRSTSSTSLPNVHS